MIRKIKKEVGCSFKENIQYMDQTLPPGDGDRWKRIGILLH